ncbi:DJ-1/PfpI family protein [Marinicrinis lubricantis]|uniref:DJ-1/PfpI family protein n=1 Tax=Marinicrinis lubricantis TaxID=2086470 RepID=A0ABW1IR38_9BACL
MKIGFVLFNQVTFLDFVGFYDVIYRLNLFEQTKGTSWELCGWTEDITDEIGITIKVDKVKPDLSEYDMLFVPGGMGTRKLKDDVEFVEWLRTAEQVPYKLSVCTGALLLGAAGFLQDKTATTNPTAYELLEPYCKEVVQARIVKDGHIITAGGVTASIDLGLYVLESLAGKSAAEQVKKQLDYPYTAERIVEL